MGDVSRSVFLLSGVKNSFFTRCGMFDGVLDTHCSYLASRHSHMHGASARCTRAEARPSAGRTCGSLGVVVLRSDVQRRRESVCPELVVHGRIPKP